MVVALWVCTVMFWVVVTLNFFVINRYESRMAWRRRLGERIMLAIFDAIDWVRVRVFRRASWKVTKESVVITSFLIKHNIRHEVRAVPGGGVTYHIHVDDAPRLKDILDKMESRHETDDGKPVWP